MENNGYYVCAGIRYFGYDVAEYDGERLWIEFEDSQDARHLTDLLNSGKAKVNHDTLVLDLSAEDGMVAAGAATERNP